MGYAVQAVIMWVARVFVSLISLFKGELDKVLFDIPYHPRIVIVTTLITMIVSIVIGRRLVRNVKRTISHELSKEKVVEITERVEQGLLYMKKDSGTIGGSAKRQLKQLLLGLGILALVVVAFIIVLLIGVWIMR